MAAPKPHVRKDIMEAALVEFAQAGYDRTTMDTIAVRAAVAKGSLYYHFDSKESLFHALFEERAERLAEVTEAAIKTSPWDGVMQSWVNFFWHEQAFLELFLSEAWRNQEREKLVQRFLQRIVAPLIPFFHRSEQDAEVLGYSLFGAIAVPSLHVLKDPEPDRTSLDRLVLTLSGWLKQQMQ